MTIANNDVVRRSGSTFVCKLPDWYDDRGKFTLFQGCIIIAHPEHPPMHFVNGSWVELEVA